MSGKSDERTVVRRTGHGWLAIRMYFDEELYQAEGRSKDEARYNLNRKMIERFETKFIGKVVSLDTLINHKL